MAILGNKNVDITVLFNGELLEEEVIKAGMKGLRKCGELILFKAQSEAPIITGALRRSGSVQKRGTDVEISFNTPYALRVHEGGAVTVKAHAVKEHEVKEHTVTNFMGTGKTVTIRAHKRKGHTVSEYTTKNQKAAKYLERPFNELSQKAEYYVENEIANEVFKAKAEKWGYLK